MERYARCELYVFTAFLDESTLVKSELSHGQWGLTRQQTFWGFGDGWSVAGKCVPKIIAEYIRTDCCVHKTTLVVDWEEIRKIFRRFSSYFDNQQIVEKIHAIKAWGKVDYKRKLHVTLILRLFTDWLKRKFLKRFIRVRSIKTRINFRNHHDIHNRCWKLDNTFTYIH